MHCYRYCLNAVLRQAFFTGMDFESGWLFEDLLDTLRVGMGIVHIRLSIHPDWIGLEQKVLMGL